MQRPSQYLVLLVKSLALDKEAENKEHESQSLCYAATVYACLEGCETWDVGSASNQLLK